MDDARRLADVFLQVHTLSSQHDNAREQIQSIHRDIPKLRYEFAKIEHSFSEIKSSLEAYKSEVDKLKALVAVVREEMARNLNAHQKEMSSKSEQKDSVLKELIFEIESIKKKIERADLKIEDVAMDSRNAILKSVNSDILVQLYRKKLDNIQLMLKNQELSK